MKNQRDTDKKLNVAVRKRDGHKCAICKKRKRGKNLQIHHIFRWVDSPGLRYDINNLICLCRQCHKDITGVEYIWAEYFIGVINERIKK